LGTGKENSADQIRNGTHVSQIKVPLTEAQRELRRINGRLGGLASQKKR
jgi:hypothetical protein